MEYSRRRGDGELHKLELRRVELRSLELSSHDRVENWHLSEKIRDNIYVNRPDTEKLKGDCSPEILKLNLRTKVKDRLKSSKLRKRDNVNSNLKAISKPQTARDASETRPEVKRFRKPSDRERRPTLVTCWKNVGNMDTEEGPDTATPWVGKESSEEEEMMEVSPAKSSPRKGKRKSEEKGSKTPRQTEKENRKEVARKVPTRKQKTRKAGEDEFYHAPLGEFWKGRSKELDESPGKAVIIYQRENRRKCLNPRTRDGFQYEQISFTGSYDLVQSKRSFSEPRHHSRNSLKEFYVSRRRTRFDMEPVKCSPTHSDFQSTMNLLNEYRTSLEYQKFSDNIGNTKCVLQCYKTSAENQSGSKGCQVVRQSSVASSSQKTPTDKEVVAARLKETAKKKLNLHREMIRAEKKNKKKFWESIQRSLNYRCALAEMLSSTQSFLSKDESSRAVSTCNASTGRSACQGIFVQENVIEKISSYQSSEILGSPKTKCRKKAKSKTHSSRPSQMATYRVSRDVTPSLLIPEEGFEKQILTKHDLDDLAYGLTSQTTLTPTENTFKLSANSLWDTASRKRNQFENSRGVDRNPSSELESLMAKLSREIRRCSYFIKELNSSEQTDKDKPRDCFSNQVSSSDSKLEVIKDYESRKDIFSGECLNTIMVYQIAESVQKKSKMKAGDKKSVDNSIEVKYSRKKESRGRKREKGILNSEPILKRVTSNRSYCSSRVASSTSSSIASRKGAKDNNRDVICCDYCKFLKNRIFKLEKDLERIEKILPFYPVEYRDSLRNCLERLKSASDCVLKRLKSCANSRHEERQKEDSKMVVKGDVKRPKSVPLVEGQSVTIVKSFLRSSTSENEVNRGTKSIGVTTEPMTEVSEDKTIPSDRAIAVKEQQTSFVVDTNYSTTPTTDPTVKTFSDNASSNPFLDLVLLVPGVKELNPELSETPTQTDGNSSVAMGKDDSCSSVKKESTNLGQEQSFQEDPKYVKQPEDCQSSSSHQSETNDSVKKTESAKNKAKKTEVNSGSREFVVIEKTEMEKVKTSDKKERPKWSRIPTRRKATLNVSLKIPDSVFVKSNWKGGSKSDGNSVQHGPKFIPGHPPETTSTKPTEVGHRKEKILWYKKKFRVSKSTQVYVKCNGGERTDRILLDAGTQTEGKFDVTSSSKVKKDDKQVQTCSPSRMPTRTSQTKHGSSSNSFDVASQVEFIGSCPLSKATEVTNVSIQTSRPSGLADSTASVAVQTNLPTEEEMKYQKELYVQKKVNVAIAELCFHLSQTRDQGKE